ncbi:methyltransferase domain-containing protein [Dehalococcoidia bacterium]|nr:methyltransferase domain-containing protein [Dehalococcoidia bacterium]
MQENIDLQWDDGHVLPSKVYPDVAFLFRRMTEVTLGEVGTESGEIILDIGCGRAIDAIELARKGGICIGIEPSKKMLDHARKSIAESGLEVSLIRGVGEHLPFKSGSLDKVVCKGSLDHFPDPARALEETSRVLKSRGRAIIAIANFESLGFRLGRGLFALEKIISRGKANRENVWNTPADHTCKFDYVTLKRLAEPRLEAKRFTGTSLLFGLPGWSLLLDKLPQRASLAIMSSLDKLARHFPSLSDVIVLKCSPKANPKPQPPLPSTSD